METPDKEGLQAPSAYKTVIKEEKLPIFEQAAQESGYGLAVTAREGEEISIKDKSESGFHTVKVSPGCVQVAVTVPLGKTKEEGTTPFYDTVRRLEQTPK